MHKRSLVLNIAIYGFLIASTVLMIYPLIYMFLGSFMTIAEYSRVSILPIPSEFRLDEYAQLLSGVNGVLPSFGVTFLRVGWYVILAIMVSLFGGYVFSRLRFPGKNVIFMFFLSGLVVPGLLLLLPLFMMIARFPLVGGNSIAGVGGSGFVNTNGALMIVGMVDVFAIFLVKQSFDMLPREYEEAAIIDGAGLLTIIFRIYVPMLKPALVTVVIIVFFAIWNDYLWPLQVVSGRSDLTQAAVQVQRAIYSSMRSGTGPNQTPYPAVFAAAALVSLPPIVLYLFLQRYFVQGLAATGLKG